MPSDGQAADEQILEYMGVVRALAFQVLRDPHLADDVCQQVCLTALRSPPREKARLRSWLSVVARNTALSALRSVRRRDRLERAAAVSESAPSNELSEAWERNRSEIGGAVLALAEPYRNTVLRRYYENQPPRVIALADRVAVATVSSRLQRAFRELRRRLERENGPRSRGHSHS